MAQRKEIMVNGRLTPVWQTDSTAQQIDDTVKTTRYQCNPNLLDNWCFLPGCVVNQRGQTSYSGVECGIDRWIQWPVAATITISAEGVTFAKNNADYAQFGQRLEQSLWDSLDGQTVTMSALASGGQLAVTTQTFSNGIAQTPAFAGVTFHSAQSQRLLDFVLVADQSPAIIAVKLELGDQQTLAHQDADGNWVLNEIPNYAEQLARCQRYQRFVSRGTLCQIVNNESIVLKVPFDGPMRAAPAISVINPQMAFCTATVWFPIPSGPVSVVSANVTEYGITYIHLAGWDFSSGSVLLPAETLGTLATDNVILLDANL